MPVHDWTRVDAGIFHDFHHSWVEEIKRALNGGLLPADYYALAEQFAGGFGPDVLTLQARDPTEEAPDDGSPGSGNGTSGTRAVAVAPPRVRFTASTDMEYYVRKQTSVVIRHVSNDRVIALVEVSPGNKASRHALRAFVEKAAEILAHDCHLLVLDLHPPGPRDPNGIHGAVWEEIGDATYRQPPDKPLTLAAYSAGLVKTAYVEPVAVGDVLPDMPLFLKPEEYIDVPLEKTYRAAWQGVPRRWQRVLEAPAP
jgi:hypothetical protein